MNPELIADDDRAAAVVETVTSAYQKAQPKLIVVQRDPVGNGGVTRTLWEAS